MDEKHAQQPRPRDNFKAWEDPLYNDLRRIFSRSSLRSVLTHSLFYENEGTEIEAFKTNAALQVTKGNKAAGTRARKNALEITKLMKEFRKVSVEASK